MKHITPYYLAYEDQKALYIAFLNRQSANISKAYQAGKVSKAYVQQMQRYIDHANKLFDIMDEMFFKMQPSQYDNEVARLQEQIAFFHTQWVNTLTEYSEFIELSADITQGLINDG